MIDDPNEPLLHTASMLRWEALKRDFVLRRHYALGARTKLTAPSVEQAIQAEEHEEAEEAAAEAAEAAEAGAEAAEAAEAGEANEKSPTA